MTEILIKWMSGKLQVPDDFAASVSDSGIARLDYSHDDAAALTVFPELIRHDPFDRMLAAQAIARRLTLLTADGVLLALGRSDFIDSRV